jgi:predicted MFS family arabinose efflux permease
MKIARPILMVTTPLGMVLGLREAWRFHAWLAVLMGVLMAVVAGFFLLTLRRIRQEQNR